THAGDRWRRVCRRGGVGDHSGVVLQGDPAALRLGSAVFPHGAASPSFPEARLARDQGRPALLGPVVDVRPRRARNPQTALNPMKSAPLQPAATSPATIILTLSPGRTEPQQRELRRTPRRPAREPRPAGDDVNSARVLRLWLG